MLVAMDAGVDAIPAIRAVLRPGERVLWHSQPGAISLFLTVLPRIVRDLILLALVITAGALDWADKTAVLPLMVIIVFAILLLATIIASFREAMAAPISHYLITNHRLILILPRAQATPDRVRRRGAPCEPDDRWDRHVEGPARCGAFRGGRATIRVRVKGDFQIYAGQYGFITRRRTRTYRLISVTEPERAVALLNQ